MKFCIILFFIIFSVADLISANISGFVKSNESEETLIGVNIRITDTKFGAVTNKNGFLYNS